MRSQHNYFEFFCLLFVIVVVVGIDVIVDVVV